MRDWSLSSWALDLKAVLRVSRRRIWASAGIILSLGIGIGVNVTVFGVLYSILLKPLPYAKVESVVVVEEVEQRSDRNHIRGLSDSEFLRLRTQTSAPGELVLVKPAERYTFSHQGRADILSGKPVTQGFFQILGAAVHRGRSFTRGDESPGAPLAIILSYDYWMTHWGGSPEIIGSPVQLDGQPATVVGVAPPGFQFLYTPTQAWISAQPKMEETSSHLGLVIGRMPPDAPKLPIAERLGSMLDFSAASHWPETEIRITSLQSYFREMHLFRADVLPRIYAVAAFVLLILLLATANAGGILLARAYSRHQEIQVRHWLGASRRRLAAGVLMEALLLSGFAAFIGIFVSYWMMQSLLQELPLDLQRFQISLSTATLAFAAGLTLLTGFLLGLAPALASTARGLTLPGSGWELRTFRLQRLSIVVQIALCVAIFIGTGLILNSMWRLWRLDPGFRPDNLLVAELELPPGQYLIDGEDGQKQVAPHQAAFVESLLEGVRSLPDVRHAAVTTQLFQQGVITYRLLGEKEGSLPWVMAYRPVSEEFFDAMGMTFVKGRSFGRTGASSDASVVISRRAARRLWPGSEPAGSLIIDGMPEEVQWRITGVVSDTRQAEISKSPVPTVYVPYDRQPFDQGLGRARLSLDLIVRSAGEPSSLAAPLREIIRRLAPLQPITRIRTMRQVLRGQLAEREFYLAVGGGLSGLALALVLVGIVGILNVHVATHRREFGIRMALGANARQITKGVLRRTLTDGAAGCLAGIFTAIALSQVLEGQLYEISAYDPASFGLATLFVMGCLFLASLAPAFRAGEVDPAALLRLE